MVRSVSRHHSLAVVLIFAWCCVAHSQPVPEVDVAAFRRATSELVSDVTNGDTRVAEAVARGFDSPDRSPEAVGFYLSDDVPDYEVGFRTAIRALDNAGYLLAFEDKYANEALYLLSKSTKVLSKPRVLETKTRKFLDELSSQYEESPKKESGAARKFEAAARQLEEAAAREGRYLLSFDLGGGDTHFVLPVSEAAYAKWRNVSFAPDLAVTEVAWSLIWESIAYYVFDTEGSLEYEAPELRPLTGALGR